MKKTDVPKRRQSRPSADKKYLRKWRRQDRKQRGDWTWGDLWRWIKGGMK